MIFGAWMRNGLLMATLAQALIGASLVWDKVLLNHLRTTNLVNYVFWLGALSIFGLITMPFGFKPSTARNYQRSVCQWDARSSCNLSGLCRAEAG